MTLVCFNYIKGLKRNTEKDPEKMIVGRKEGRKKKEREPEIVSD